MATPGLARAAPMPQKTAIILVNYQDYARRFLEACRDSIREQAYPPELIKVYIVDNATSAESRLFLETQYPEAHIIPRRDGNYAAANNAGIQQAWEDSCQYFVIANMDTVFERNWLAELVTALETEATVGIVQSKILLYPQSREEQRRPNIYSLGGIIHFLGFGLNQGYREPDREVEGWPEISGFACGCSLIVKREVIQAIKGYNEEYYMYHDDLELGWKARLAGYKILLAPKSVVYHKYEVARSLHMSYYLDRNRYLSVFTFYRLSTLLLILPALLAMDVAVLGYWLVTGRLREKLKVYAYFLKRSTWRKIRRARAGVNRLRRLPEKEIIKNFGGKIEFQEISNTLLELVVNPLLDRYWRRVQGFLAE